MIFNSINEMVQVSFVTSTTETIIFRNKKHRVGKYSHRWWKKNHVFTEFANREIFVGLSHMFCFFWQKQKAVFFATKTAFRFRQCCTSIFAKQKAVFPGENSSSWNKREALFVKIFPFWRQKSLHSMQMSPGGLRRKEGKGRRLARTHIDMSVAGK